MANREATSIDVAFYGNGMVENDIIIDSRTSVHADGKGKLFINDLAARFPTARNGCTIWLHGTLLGLLYEFRIHNGDSPPTSTYPQSLDPDNPVNVRVIEGTQVKIERNSTSNGGFCMLILDMKYVVLNGENDAYPGMRDGIGVHSTFLTGSFGIWLTGGTDLISNHVLSIAVADGGKFTVIGVEVVHGFAGIRYQGGNYTYITSLTVKRCYLHDAVDGEGFYLGATHGPPFAQLKDLNIEDVIIARRACESLQLQHLVESAERAEVKNFVIFAGDSSWLSEFQPSQDSCIQWSCDDGNQYISNGLIDGYASVGLVLYGNTLHTPASEKPATIQNCLFNDARGNFMYINVSTSQGMNWVYRKIYLTNFNNTYFTDTLQTIDDFYVSANNGSDKHKLQQIYYDGIGKTNVFQNPSSFDMIDIQKKTDLGTIEYVNSGFYERAEKIQQWKQFVAKYLCGLDNYPTHHFVNDIVINCVDTIEYAFYKCLIEHDTDSSVEQLTRPDKDTSGKWLKLSWDYLGVRNDQPTWNSSFTQSAYPPDDFRLKSNNYWNKKKMGVYSNELNTDHTQTSWFRNKYPSRNGAIRIPGGNQLTYTVQESDKGKYLAHATRAKDKNGIYGEWKFSAWRLI